jgi:hypothetical protein
MMTKQTKKAVAKTNKIQIVNQNKRQVVALTGRTAIIKKSGSALFSLRYSIRRSGIEGVLCLQFLSG